MSADRAYYDALHALRMTHDRELADLQRRMPVNYAVLAAGITQRYRSQKRTLDKKYGKDTE